MQTYSQLRAPVAVIARLYGLNMGVAHRCRMLQREMTKQAIEPALALLSTPDFVAVAVQSDAVASCASADIRIEVRRDASAATIHWTVASAAARASGYVDGCGDLS